MNYKVFLSHSSKNKWYVRQIADRLKRDAIEYDEYTFDEGVKTLDEVYSALDSTGIFVLFLSKNAFQSIWVQKEIVRASEYILNGKINRFLPIVIDTDIKYDSPEVPTWMSDAYNLKLVSKPTMAYGMIRRIMLTVYMDLYPEVRASDRQFAGRNNEVREFESAYRNPDREKPVCCMVSGLPSIGRRTFLKYSLTKVNVLRNGGGISEISLNKACSIDALIERVCLYAGLNLAKEVKQSLAVTSMDEKVLLATKYIEELSSQKQTLLIIDSGCLVDQSGHIADWFVKIVNKLASYSHKVKICVVSQYKTSWRQVNQSASIQYMDLKELDANDRYSLLEQLLEIENIDTTLEERKNIAGLLTGYPEQVKYAIAVIKEEGKEYLLNHLYELSDYVENSIFRVIRKCNSGDELMVQLLTLLSMSEGLSLKVILEVFKGKEEEIKSHIRVLTNSFVVEYVDNGKEYLRLNDAVKSYVQRTDEYALNTKYDNAFHQHIKAAITNSNIEEEDPYDFITSIKEALKRGEKVHDYQLIPSHYLTAIKELYHSQRTHATLRLIVDLADRVLVNERFMDERFINNVRYYKCMALSRMKDGKALQEMQKMHGAAHLYLKGFYYRMTGRYDDAINSYLQALDSDSGYFQAKRDLVHCYLNTENYEDALQPAKELYKRMNNNPIFIQSYIRCILHVYGHDERNLLETLLNELHRLPDAKANEMYMTSKALLCANIDKDIPHALQYADDAINTFPDVIYPYLTKMEILSKTSDVDKIEDVLRSVESKFDTDSEIYSKFPYIACKCLSYAMSLQKSMAETYMEQHLYHSRFPQRLIRTIENKVKNCFKIRNKSSQK